MESMYYIGLDVHKKTISYCVKDASGRMHAEGKIPDTRFDQGRIEGVGAAGVLPSRGARELILGQGRLLPGTRYSLTNENSRFLAELNLGDCHSRLAQPGPLSLSSVVLYRSELRLILASSNTTLFRNSRRNRS